MEKCTQTSGSSLWLADYRKLQQFLHGEISAWDELYLEAYPIAVRVLRKQSTFRFLREDDVPDIISEAFRRCLLRAASFEGRSCFSTWVCGFVRYVALEAARKICTSEIRLRRSVWLCEKRSYGGNPETLLIIKERDDCLWLAFDSLSRLHRALVGHFVLQWYSYSEIRRMTGLCRDEMEHELNVAIYILRRRFLAIYPPKFSIVMSQ